MMTYAFLLLIVNCCMQLLVAQGPMISTENGNVKITSSGDIVLQAGQEGSVQLLTGSGEAVNMTGPPGPPGLKGEKGDTGPRGQDGGVISWNECTWQDLNSGLDYGLITTCRYNKLRDETWLRLTWIGNLRITRCETCCMRWYITIDGEECSDPGPIDAVIFQSRNYHIVRQSTISGSCRTIGTVGNGTVIGMGPKRIQFSVRDCPGFGGFVYDAYTGWNSVSRILIEEIMPRDDTFPVVAVTPPESYIYTPSYCQYLFPDLGINSERNLGTIAKVNFMKMHEHTVLRITWEGNFRKKSCTNCCSRWFFEIDGAPCDTPIETAIASSRAYDIFAPTTLTGVCDSAGELLISNGLHSVRLAVGNCPGSRVSNTASGFHSTSRFIVEEIPRPRDPQLKSPTSAYHPVWTNCNFPIDDGNVNEGPINTATCTGNKNFLDSSVRVTFNGNIRTTNCHDCCVRWFVTLNGEECTRPAPIEAVIYSTDAARVNMHRSATITGLCESTASGAIQAGNVTALVNVGMCNGFNETFNAFTGFGTNANILIEEYPKPVNNPPPDGTFYPNWVQCVSTENSTESNSTALYSCQFPKRAAATSLKISWDGNVAVLNCTDCCVRWFIAVDGQECEDPGPIDGAIRQDLTDSTIGTFDLYRPITVAGICHGTSDSSPLASGDHTISLGIGECEPATNGDVIPLADVMTGYNSVSRFIVEELPRQEEGCDVTLLP